MTAEQVDDVAELRHDVEDVVRDVAEGALRYLPPVDTSPSDRAKIVVVGEVRSGKTSLVNALIGRPDLLPIAPTSTYVAIGAGVPEELRVHRDGGVVAQGLPEVERWLGRDAAEGITHAEVLLDDRRLENFTLFDTPGVGGFDPAASELTLAALEHATAMVFVCSADAKVSIAERSFLAEAASRIQHVLFVMTKVDLLDDLGAANLLEFETTVRESARREDKFANMSFCRFSATLAIEGANGDDEALAASGFDELWRELDEIAGQTTELAKLNDLRALKSTMTEAFRLLAQRRNAVADPADADIVEAHEAQLRDLSTKWRPDLLREWQKARETVRKELRRRIKVLREDYNARLAEPRRVDVEATEADMHKDFEALHEDIVRAIEAQVTEVARQLLTSIPGTDVHGSAADMEAKLTRPDETPSDYLAARPAPPKDPNESITRIQQPYILSNLFNNAKRTVDSYGDKVAEGGSGFSAGGLLFGAAIYAWGAKRRKHHSNVGSLRAAFNTWVGEVNNELKTEISNGFEGALYNLQQTVEAELRAATTVLADAKKARQLDAKERSKEERRIADLAERLKPLQHRWNAQHAALVALTADPQIAISGH